MADETPNGNLALAVGELKGAVTGLATMLENQNKTSSDFRKEIMEIFKGMREDNKQQAELFQKHLKEDSDMYATVGKLADWQKDTAPKVDDLWDRSNNQKGFLAAIGLVGSIIGGSIVASVEYFKR